MKVSYTDFRWSAWYSHTCSYYPGGEVNVDLGLQYSQPRVNRLVLMVSSITMKQL